MSELQEIRNQINHIKQYGQHFTQSEAIMAGNKLKELRDRYYRVVTSQAIDQLQKKAHYLKIANDYARALEKKSINEWNREKLAVELSINSILVDMSLKASEPAKAIERLADEAIKSGDKYKLRGLREVLAGGISKLSQLDDRRSLNAIQYKLDNEISKLASPEMQKAKEQVEKDYQAFNEQVSEYKQIARDIGEDDNLDYPMATAPMGAYYQSLKVIKNELGLPEAVERKDE